VRVCLVGAVLAATLFASCGGTTVTRQTVLRWSPAPTVDDAGNADVARITSGAPGGVAVGSVAETGDTEAAVWTSGDDEHWKRVSDDAQAFSLPSAIRSVATGAGGFVAVGTAGARGAVWISGDGVRWTREADGDPAFADAAIASIQGGVQPGYIAVGTKDSRAAAWSSEDGRSWKLAAIPAAPSGSRMNNVTAAGPGVVAVGSDGDAGAVWASADGVRWSRWFTNGRPFPPGSELKALQPTAPAFVAVGRDSRGPAAWRSGDGHRWTEVTLGSDGAEADSLVAGAPGGLVAVGGGPHGMEAWISADNARHWKSARTGLPSGPPGRLRTVRVLRPGFVAGGDATGAPIWVSP
jgi:hypothetical protein